MGVGEWEVSHRRFSFYLESFDSGDFFKNCVLTKGHAYGWEKL